MKAYERVCIHCDHHHVYTSDADDIDTCPGCGADANPISRVAEAQDLAITPTQAEALKKLIGRAGEMQSRIVKGEEDENLPAYIDAFRAYYAIGASKGVQTMPIATRETRLACVHRMQWLYSTPDNRRRIENGFLQEVTTCDYSALPLDAHTHPAFGAFRRQMAARGRYPDHMLVSAWDWFRVGWDEQEQKEKL